MMSRTPYIGITDFFTSEEVTRMFRIVKDRNIRRKLMVGVMMSYKTLHDLPTKWKNAFPKKERVADIFYSDEAYNCLHYADYTIDPQLSNSLALALSYGGIGIHAVQLDMIWPDPGQVASGVHASRKNLEVILQLNTDALNEVNNDPDNLAARLADYEGVIHRVLLDKSGGKGQGMCAALLEPFLDTLSAKTPWLSLGVAGGLGPKTMHLLGNLPSFCPNLSIDAQGQLRPSASALDPIDWSMAADYLEQALDIFEYVD